PLLYYAAWVHYRGMKPPRLPRFKRSVVAGELQLTERDVEIVRYVRAHRFSRSSNIAALLASTLQPVLRRLQLLYHHGYLERPRAQLDYYHKGGSRTMVYGMGDKGAALLKSDRRVRW